MKAGILRFRSMSKSFPSTYRVAHVCHTNKIMCKRTHTHTIVWMVNIEIQHQHH